MSRAVSIVLLVLVVAFVIQATGGYHHAVDAVTLPRIVTPGR